MSIVITGAAGFIGFHLSRHLLRKGYTVAGVDNLNDYYDTGLKRGRLQLLSDSSSFTFHQADVTDLNAVARVLEQHSADTVIHLAAQAGVRHSLTHPEQYVSSNLQGFSTMIEASRLQRVKHFIYASSSSVYGNRPGTPFSVEDRTDRPASLYAATKKANELIAHAYSSSFGLPTTGMRFFTVYGPWGRPDMAYFKFTKSILLGEPITVYNYGKSKRDFTYVDDVILGIEKVLSHPPSATVDKPVPAAIYNFGNSKPVELLRFIQILERLLGKEAILKLDVMPAGDVADTFADISLTRQELGFEPSTGLETGLSHFVNWYKEYYKVTL
ncbi:capsular biosynthesis protein CpsI [Cohnella kolymensis]|uniref:Capsular biosynthesis protein CpsI n=1 Tax=Cohnella kolymensis TaxID=1590652 RepID=A0ABR5A9C7_9BACL|nr:SDR family NAD(P)-dependent oxidoreductase [Cohnella kolymensis]KIL37448.1 capsular biosynthesis protein CpsI [Cohnella kolymensis]